MDSKFNHIQPHHAIMTTATIDIPLLENPEAIPQYPLIHDMLESISTNVGPTTCFNILVDFSARLLEKEAVLNAPKPNLRKLLDLKNQKVIGQIIADNQKSLVGSSTIQNLFKIPKSTLHHARETDRVIAYKPPGGSEYLYPVEQFDGDTIPKWPAALIKTLGNGEDALHFFYVPRIPLNGKSYATIMQTPAKRDSIIKLMTETAAKFAEI